MTFEELYARARALAIPASNNERRIEWCDELRRLGIARESCGAYEVFLRGSPLIVRDHALRRHVRFDKWSACDGEVFTASRIVFPADLHYCAIAAFAAEELYRCGLLVDMQLAFASAEPILEVALRRAVLTEEMIVGLIGELRFLTILFSGVTSAELRAHALNAWRGYERAARDFVFPGIAIEVKTSRGPRSLHHIGSIGQVDADRMPTGAPAEGLFLVSIGIEEIAASEDAAGVLTVPGMVDRLLEMLRDPDDADKQTESQHLLLDRIAHYGGGLAVYDHCRMKSWPAFQAGYRQHFMRIYDLNDPEIAVIRRGTVAECTHVIKDSVQFTVDLPDVIRGDLNPVVDSDGFVARLRDKIQR